MTPLDKFIAEAQAEDLPLALEMLKQQQKIIENLIRATQQEPVTGSLCKDISCLNRLAEGMKK